MLNINKTRKTGGGLYPDGLIIGCIFLFACRWAYNRGGGGGLISGWAYKRQFTVSSLNKPYVSIFPFEASREFSLGLGILI